MDSYKSPIKKLVSCTPPETSENPKGKSNLPDFLYKCDTMNLSK